MSVCEKGIKILKECHTFRHLKELIEIRLVGLKYGYIFQEKALYEKYQERIEAISILISHKQNRNIFFENLSSNFRYLLNEKVKSVRIERKITQNELGGIDCEPETISRIERGKGEFISYHYRQLASKLNLTEFRYNFIKSVDIKLLEVLDILKIYFIKVFRKCHVI